MAIVYEVTWLGSSWDILIYWRCSSPVYSFISRPHLVTYSASLFHVCMSKYCRSRHSEPPSLLDSHRIMTLGPTMFFLVPRIARVMAMTRAADNERALDYSLTATRKRQRA